MALQHETLGVGQRAGLAQDFLRNRELPEIVEASREASELDLLGLEAEPAANAGGQIADPFGVAPGIRVACVDCLCQGRRGAVARGLVGSCGERLDLRELDGIRAVGAGAVLCSLPP